MKNRLKHKLTSLRPGIYRRVRYRKGHGVHSPFVYNLITRVIEEKAPFYAFDEIESFRKELYSKDDKAAFLAHHPDQHRNLGALLFRLVNFFKCATVVEIGSSSGMLSLYLAMASPARCRCYALEERAGVLSAVRAYAERQGLANLRMVEGNYAESLKRLDDSLDKIDLLFVNHTGADVEKMIRSLAPKMHSKTLLVVNHIRHNREMKDLWTKIKQSETTHTTIDLYQLGLVFFDDKRPKQHYKTYFDYGKKQNLYRNGRRRLHFPRKRRARS